MLEDRKIGKEKRRTRKSSMINDKTMKRQPQGKIYLSGNLSTKQGAKMKLDRDASLHQMYYNSFTTREDTMIRQHKLHDDSFKMRWKIKIKNEIGDIDLSASKIKRNFTSAKNIKRA